MGICCMTWGTQIGAPWPSMRVGCRGRWEGGSGGREHGCTLGWFLLTCNRKPQDFVKQYPSIKKNKMGGKVEDRCRIELKRWLLISFKFTLIKSAIFLPILLTKQIALCIMYFWTSFHPQPDLPKQTSHVTFLKGLIFRSFLFRDCFTKTFMLS